MASGDRWTSDRSYYGNDPQGIYPSQYRDQVTTTNPLPYVSNPPRSDRHYGNYTKYSTYHGNHPIQNPCWENRGYQTLPSYSSKRKIDGTSGAQDFNYHGNHPIQNPYWGDRGYQTLPSYSSYDGSSYNRNRESRPEPRQERGGEYRATLASSSSPNHSLTPDREFGQKNRYRLDSAQPNSRGTQGWSREEDAMLEYSIGKGDRPHEAARYFTHRTTESCRQRASKLGLKPR